MYYIPFCAVKLFYAQAIVVYLYAFIKTGEWIMLSIAACLTVILLVRIWDRQNNQLHKEPT